jgi:hypothetical protein
VILNELEAAHQIVSPAKYFAAARRMSRSTVSLTFSASRQAIRADFDSGRADPGDPTTDVDTAPEPNPRTQPCNVPRPMPRSAAIPFNVAPGVDSYKSTACRRNSSV